MNRIEMKITQKKLEKKTQYLIQITKLQQYNNTKKRQKKGH